MKTQRYCGGCNGVVVQGELCDCQKRKRGAYDYAWRQLSIYYRKKNPLCERCKEAGRTAIGRHVHHVVPIRVAPELRLEYANLRSLCTVCHTIEEKEASRLYPAGSRKKSGVSYP